MILSIVLIVIIPIILAYVGAFFEFLVDKNTDIGDWHRTPSRMIIMMSTFILIILSMSLGIYNLRDVFNLNN